MNDIDTAFAAFSSLLRENRIVTSLDNIYIREYFYTLKNITDTKMGYVHFIVCIRIHISVSAMLSAMQFVIARIILLRMYDCSVNHTLFEHTICMYMYLGMALFRWLRYQALTFRIFQ